MYSTEKKSSVADIFQLRSPIIIKKVLGDSSMSYFTEQLWPTTSDDICKLILGSKIVKNKFLIGIVCCHCLAAFLDKPIFSRKNPVKNL